MVLSVKFVFFCGFSIVVRGEVYSSASDMKNIFEMEADLAHILDSYSNTLQAKLDRINKYIEVNQTTSLKTVVGCEPLLIMGGYNAMVLNSTHYCHKSINPMDNFKIEYFFWDNLLTLEHNLGGCPEMTFVK